MVARAENEDDLLDILDFRESMMFEHAECGAQLELVTSEGRRILRLAEEVGEDWGE
jgi:hypothetical protein